MCEKQRSRLRNISPKTKLSNDQVELLFQACAERALKGNETDLELVLGLLYSEHFRSTLLARSMVPSLYARNPQAFATCFMKEMIRHQGHRDKETGKLVIEDMFVNARTALFALCYHLKNHGKEMSRSLPPLKISESEPAIPMRTAVNLCYQTAWRHINLDNVVCYTQPTSDPTSFGKHFTPDRMVQPMELACARDVAINFDQRKNSRSSWFARLKKLFTFSLSSSDYFVKDKDKPVRYGGVIKWRDERDDQSVRVKTRKIFREKIEFTVEQHLREWKRGDKKNLTTIFDVCEIEERGTRPVRYYQLVLSNDRAVVLDTSPPRWEGNEYKSRRTVNHLAGVLGSTRLKNTQIHHYYLPRTTKSNIPYNQVKFNIDGVNHPDNDTIKLWTTSSTRKFPGARPLPIESKEKLDQKNFGSLLGLYLREQLEGSGLIGKEDGEVLLGDSIGKIMQDYIQSDREEQDETERRLRMELTSDVDEQNIRIAMPWWS